MLGSHAIEQQAVDATPITPYMDRRLASSNDLYFQFVYDLFRANVIDFTANPLDIVTPFFVAKRGKAKLR